MQNANTCDTVLKLFTSLDMHKKNSPVSRNSESVRINANNRFEPQSVKYGAFPDGTNVVTPLTVRMYVQIAVYLNWGVG